MGPDRPTFTCKTPPSYITFNSITDSPIGDERSFVGVRDTATGDRGHANLWHNSIVVEEGHEYIIRVFVHNNAADNLKLQAESVRTFVNLPTSTDTSIRVFATISADNATPQKIWDHVTLTSDREFNLVPIDKSIIWENNCIGSNTPRGDCPAGVGGHGPLVLEGYDLFTNKGVLLGYAAMDGKLLPGYQYSGYLSFRVRPQFRPQVAVPEKQEAGRETELHHDVFISYSTKDQDVADHVYDALTKLGVRCWMATRNIGAGKTYSGEIVRGIKGCAVVLLLFSAAANESSAIVNEVEFAFRTKKTLLTWRLDNAVPNDDLSFFLLSRQWVDAEGGVNDRLLAEVKALVSLPDQDGDATIVGESSAPTGTTSSSARLGITVAVATHQEISDAVEKLELTAWHDVVEANAGDLIDVLIDYRNAGSANNLRVMLRNVLSIGLTYVPNSTKFVSFRADGELRGGGDFINLPEKADESTYNVCTGGLWASTATGGFRPTTSQHSYCLMFTVRVSDGIDLSDGDMTLSSTGYVSADVDGTRYYNSDTANILVRTTEGA